MIINVQMDGSCLFRCLAIFLNPKLQEYDRFKNGKIKKRTFNSQESYLSQEIRQQVVEYLNINKEFYDSIEYQDDEYYFNIEDRIDKMANSNEYGGIIEIDCASKIYNITIEIYTDNNKRRYNKIAVFNDNIKKKQKKCKLLLLDDEHYNLIV